CPAANERNKEILKNRGLTGLSPVDGQKTHGTYADSEEVAKALAELMPLIGTLLDIATLLDENAPCGDRTLAAVAVGTCFVPMDSVEYVQHIKKMIKNKEDLTLIVTETKSLRRAMDKAGVHNLDKGQLHHIVCKTDKRCGPARGKIQQFETGLNSPANGVYLVQHNGRHTGGYW
ncbi:MAG: AHH domain-containing protein, partial [Thermoguttaceae bacterium]|nr:AHH domain-containing protein [Thermoguttaceae bacterium]